MDNEDILKEIENEEYLVSMHLRRSKYFKQLYLSQNGWIMELIDKLTDTYVYVKDEKSTICEDAAIELTIT